MSVPGDRDQLAGLRYRGRRLDGSVQQFHSAVDTLEADTVPESYYLQVLSGRANRGTGDDQVLVLEVLKREPGQDPAPVQDTQAELFEGVPPGR